MINFLAYAGITIFSFLPCTVNPNTTPANSASNCVCVQYLINPASVNGLNKNVVKKMIADDKIIRWLLFFRKMNNIVNKI